MPIDTAIFYLKESLRPYPFHTEQNAMRREIRAKQKEGATPQELAAEYELELDAIELIIEDYVPL